MRRTSSLTAEQRAAMIAMFEEGYGRESTASRLGVSQDAVRAVYDRWRLRGREALTMRPAQQEFPWEIKQEVVRRFLAGETKLSLAAAYGLGSPKTVGKWVQLYRQGGEEALRPKPKGRPPKDPGTPPPEMSEVERLRQENEYLRAQVAYLGKLRALSDRRRD